jgi:hypothetical protein
MPRTGLDPTTRYKTQIPYPLPWRYNSREVCLKMLRADETDLLASTKTLKKETIKVGITGGAARQLPGKPTY